MQGSIRFIEKKLATYDTRRNDPSADGQSGLSPYLHFGQISAQRIALEVSASAAVKKSREAFLEELIVRRELSDNYCYYNPNYDSFEGFPAWAKKTLHAHREINENIFIPAINSKMQKPMMTCGMQPRWRW